MERHVCAAFSSPEDLSIKMGVDLLRLLDNGNSPKLETKAQEVRQEIPRLLATAGYGLGMREHLLDLSGLVSLDVGNRLVLSEPQMSELVAAGYLAMNLSRGRFEVLQQIVTFNRRFWVLIVALVRLYGIESNAVSAAITNCYDPVQFRLLMNLTRDLRLEGCVDAICRASLSRLASFKRQFFELRIEEVADVSSTIQLALQAMPIGALPTLQFYLEEAKARRLWPQKRIFESAIRSVQRYVDTLGTGPLP
jgi:hypothetical protein